MIKFKQHKDSNSNNCNQIHDIREARPALCVARLTFGLGARKCLSSSQQLVCPVFARSLARQMLEEQVGPAACIEDHDTVGCMGSFRVRMLNCTATAKEKRQHNNGDQVLAGAQRTVARRQAIARGQAGALKWRNVSADTRKGVCVHFMELNNALDAGALSSRELPATSSGRGVDKPSMSGQQVVGPRAPLATRPREQRHSHS